MIRNLVLAILVLSCLAFSATPQVMVKSDGVNAYEAALEAASTDEAKVAIAREYLDKYPNDIPMLRSAQNVLNRSSDLKPEFWKERMDANPTAANRYLWARKSGDAAEMQVQAGWMMQNDPKNFWGYYLAAVAEWQKETPDLKIVSNYFAQAIEKDPSRPEGWGYAAQAYEEQEDWANALKMYEAEMVVEPSDSGPKFSIMGIYAQQRDGDNFFRMSSELVKSDPPLSFELERFGTESKLTAADLTKDYAVMEVFTYWCGPCVRHALPEANRLTEEGKMPFAFYAVHAEGKGDRALALMDSNDVNGKKWQLNFVFGTDELNERLGVTGYPSYYVVDPSGRPRAMLLGYSDTTVETLTWVIEELKRRS